VFLCVAATITAILLSAILHTTGGAFGYSLDDPYIHLALAERIVEGHYGLNMNEAAAPASSVTYPFLLAVLLKAGLGQAAALAVNLAALACTLILIAALASEAGVDLASVPATRLAVVAAALILGLNLVGLAFTGLEHELHVADTLACLVGVARALRTGRVPTWLPVVLVLNPLIRFEGMSILGAGTIVLFLERRHTPALLTLFAGLLTVGGFCLFLHHLGLPWVPSSIMVKSSMASSSGLGSTRRALEYTLLANVTEYGAPQLFLILALLAAALGQSRTARRVALFAALPIAVHLAAGAFGWFSRYEVYVLSLGWAAVLLVHGRRVASWLLGPWRGIVVAVPLWLGLQVGYVQTTWRTPLAIEEIHLQQFQMHRFINDFWQAPVAVNDLDWVSFGNPYYVLDLWGLSSEVARVERMRGGADHTWMDQLVQQRHIALAIIYTSWFEPVPTAWTPIASMTLNERQIVAGGRAVTFYATTPAAIPAIHEALAKFAPTVPAGDTFVLR
jgi:hypothetical protein